jgi:hypothetical protein
MSEKQIDNGRPHPGCPQCSGDGWYIVPEHACGGDENRCAFRCPVPYQEQCGCQWSDWGETDCTCTPYHSHESGTIEERVCEHCKKVKMMRFRFSITQIRLIPITQSIFVMIFCQGGARMTPPLMPDL